jgi:hypothetical protein
MEEDLVKLPYLTMEETLGQSSSLTLETVRMWPQLETSSLRFQVTHRPERWFLHGRSAALPVYLHFFLTSYAIGRGLTRLYAQKNPLFAVMTLTNFSRAIGKCEF